MSRNQWHIGVQECHLIFKGTLQLYYKALVSMYFYEMVMFQFASTVASHSPVVAVHALRVNLTE